MTTAIDHELGRRSSAVRGLYSLHAAHGDPYAALLDHPLSDEAVYRDLLALDPVMRSATGVWVAARHAPVLELLGHPDLTPVLDTPLVPGVWPESREPWPLSSSVPTEPEGGPRRWGEYAEPACHRLLDSLGEEFDMVRLADRLAVEVCARTCAPPVAVDRIAAHCAAAGAGLDSALCPQPLPVTTALAAAVRELRAAGTDPLFSSSGVRIASDLLSHAVGALLDHRDAWLGLVSEPGRAGEVVDEVLRFDPPVHAYQMTAVRDLAAGGVVVPSGERVVLLIGAANRDPDVHHSPLGFVPGNAVGPGPVLPGFPYDLLIPYARAQAEAALRVLATRTPDLRRAGPAPRRRNAPVTRRLSCLPVSTGQRSTQ